MTLVVLLLTANTQTGADSRTCTDTAAGGSTDVTGARCAHVRVADARARGFDLCPNKKKQCCFLRIINSG